ALGSSNRTTTSSPPHAGSRSSNTRYSDRVVDFLAFFAARFSLIDFCAVFLACFSPLSFACATVDLRSVGVPIMTRPCLDSLRGRGLVGARRDRPRRGHRWAVLPPQHPSVEGHGTDERGRQASTGSP